MSSPKCHHDSPRVVQPNKSKLIQRLNRIEGQIRGVRDMVEQDRYCIDILTQIQASRQALAAMAESLLEDHLRGCVSQAMQNDNPDEAIREVMQIVSKMRA